MIPFYGWRLSEASPLGEVHTDQRAGTMCVRPQGLDGLQRVVFWFAVSLEVCLHGLTSDESLLSGGRTHPAGHLWLVVPSNGRSEHTIVV